MLYRRMIKEDQGSTGSEGEEEPTPLALGLVFAVVLAAAFLGLFVALALR